MAITYRDAGVDLGASAELVRRLGPLAKRTRIPGVVADVGGFAGLFAAPSGIDEPILVSGSDGVGTKLEVARALGVHDTIGIDLVAMCVNDVVTSGAKPLFFLDYFATGALDVDVAESVVRGIAEGCTRAGCALLGGETAELPGRFAPGVYDLAGFAVGVVGKRDLLGAARVNAQDVLIAVASSGLHANGYALARRAFLESMKLDYDAYLPELGATVGDALLVPTRVYAQAVAALAARCGDRLHALAHITGGGIPENLPRVFPEGLAPRVDLTSYVRPAIFDLLLRGGPIDEGELRRTFNLGVGLVAIVDKTAVDDALAVLAATGETAWVLGDVVACDAPEVQFA